jgi:LEA14-like dessication related protein
MVWLSAALLVFSGCAGFGKRLTSPGMHIANIQVREVRALEAVFEIELRIINTNDVPIRIRGMECRVDFNERRFASGVSDQGVDIPPYGTAILPVVVYSSVLDMLRGALRLKDKKKLKYSIAGRVRLEGGFLVPSALPFESEGELDLEGISRSMDKHL